MNKAYCFLPMTSSSTMWRTINILFAAALWLLISNSAFALAPNPGAICPAGSFQGNLTSSDYSNLVASRNNNTYFNVAGNASGNIPLQMKMTVVESSSATINHNLGIINNAINVARDFPSATDYTDITLDFRNSSTQQPLYLTNVAMSAFDIDTLSSNGALFDDSIQITGTTKTGSTIIGEIQNIPGSNIIYDQGLITRSFSDPNCAANDLSTSCQGSIQFSQPVNNVKIRYTNTRYITGNTTYQEIDLRLDSYCYVPPVSSYAITKSDGVSSIGSGNSTTYKVKVTNTGETTLTNIVLKDPIVNGINKTSGITCDTTDSDSICTTAPTVTQLESSAGFTLPAIPVGRSYSINIPASITAATGSSVTNTATISHSTLASKSATDTNNVTSPFDNGSTLTPASCPAGHRMYYVGANVPPDTYRSLPLSSWVAGSRTGAFNFPDGTTFNINFASVVDIDTSFSPTSPYYGNISNATQSAINLVHNSNSNKTNHILNATVNKPVSKLGFVIQDVDSLSNNGNVPYREQVDVSGSSGVLTHNSTYHTINAANNIVTAISGLNCSTVGACSINATWGYKVANSPFSLTHNNTLNQTTGSHAVGYSDFYFCLAPPKVVINKQLTGNRVNDSTSNRDQFTISVNNGGTPLASFETIGSGQNITNSSGAISLAENTSYTITERVTSSVTGDIANYNATYSCTNSTSGSTTVMPTAAMTYNASNKTRSFTLSNVAYGDQITCTIINTPAVYTFTGYVFNDNGGITASSATQYDVSATFTGNANYANGVFDSNEAGISASGLQISLTDCSGNLLASSNTNPQVPSSTAGTIGQYRFEVAPGTLAGKTKVCLIETEPSSWDYTVDTTVDSREIALVSGTYEYKTQKDGSGNVTRNLDFGELKAQNAALVLRKSQYVHTCNAALNYTSIAETNDPMTGFSINPANNVQPGNCIAYKIDAFNRGHIDISDIQIKDSLQKTPVTSVFQLPKPLGNPAVVYSATNNSAVISSNGTIISDKFALSKVATSSTAPTRATLYFNSKYGAIPTAP